MTTEPLVTVIMNCYNSERWLREAIDSVYAQAYPRWEIIFWDNASTDNSPDIARSYDARLRYYRGERTLPLGAARNLAVQQARGELLAFLDCDDAWFPYTVERLVSAMADGRYAAGYGGYITVDTEGRELGRYVPNRRSGDLFRALLRQWDIGVPTMVIRTEALARTGLNFDPQVTASEEYCLLMQLAATNEFAVVNDILARYRVHDRALTNESIARWWQERVYTLDLITRAHPRIRERFPDAFAEAYARAVYYRARYYMAIGEARRARAELRSIARVNYRYRFLYVLSLLPPTTWEWVHRLRTKRRVAP